MILDHIINFNQYVNAFPFLNEVAAFIQSQNLNELQLSEKTRITDQVYIIPISAMQSAESKTTLEAHKGWMDIHYTVKGTDTIVYKAVNACTLVDTPYQEADDYMLFKDAFVGELQVPEGYFCLITPDMAHMAMCGTTAITKFVFKVQWTLSA